MNAVLNKKAPNIEPKGIRAVESESLAPARIAVNTSGAPFAKAKKVTPAKAGEIPTFKKPITKLYNKIINTRAQISVCQVIKCPE